jgi:hypothetical protein
LKERALVTINYRCHETEHIKNGSCEIAILYTKKIGVMLVSFGVFDSTACLPFHNLVHNIGNSVNYIQVKFEKILPEITSNIFNFTAYTTVSNHHCLT